MCHPSKTNIAISKYDAWKCLEDEIRFRYGPWIQGGHVNFQYLAGIQGAAVGLEPQRGCGFKFQRPLGFFTPKNAAAKAKMTRYLKGWKRILDKDNTNRCNWYEFQDAEMKLHVWFFCFGWGGV